MSPAPRHPINSALQSDAFGRNLRALIPLSVDASVPLLVCFEAFAASLELDLKRSPTLRILREDLLECVNLLILLFPSGPSATQLAKDHAALMRRTSPDHLSTALAPRTTAPETAATPAKQAHTHAHKTHTHSHSHTHEHKHKKEKKERKEKQAHATPLKKGLKRTSLLADFIATESVQLTVKRGDHVRLIQVSSDWAWVQAADGKDGYVPACYLKCFAKPQ